MRAGEGGGGRFWIEQHAGAGGIGRVPRAIDRLSGERVAVKLAQEWLG